MQLVDEGHELNLTSGLKQMIVEHKYHYSPDNNPFYLGHTHHLDICSQGK